MSYYEQSELACKGEHMRSNKIAKERMRSIHFCKLCLQKKEKQSITRLLYLFLGNVLSSRTVSSQVFSAMRSLTSVFGMGTGGAFSLSSPRMVQNTFFKYSDNCIKFFLNTITLNQSFLKAD